MSVRVTVKPGFFLPIEVEVGNGSLRLDENDVAEILLKLPVAVVLLNRKRNVGDDEPEDVD